MGGGGIYYQFDGSLGTKVQDKRSENAHRPPRHTSAAHPRAQAPTLTGEMPEAGGAGRRDREAFEAPSNRSGASGPEWEGAKNRHALYETDAVRTFEKSSHHFGRPSDKVKWIETVVINQARGRRGQATAAEASLGSCPPLLCRQPRGEAGSRASSSGR